MSEEAVSEPYDGQYDEALAKANKGLEWLSEGEAVRHAVAFYQLSPREQHLIGLVNVTMDLLAPTVGEVGNIRPEWQQVPEQITRHYLVGLLWKCRKVFRAFVKTAKDQGLLDQRLHLYKMVQTVRDASLTAGVVQQVPWPIITWFSVTGSYALATQALVGGNFKFFATACQEVAIGLAAIEVGLKEWDEAGRPEIIGGRNS